MVERKTENLEVISSSLILDTVSVLFNRLYKFLHSQRFTPTHNYSLRIWWAKNRRAQQREYLNIMHQIVGSNGLNHLQLVDVDSFMIKRVFKVGALVVVGLCCVYVLL